MSPRERVRRFVDGELDAAERAALLADAERDPVLARELADARTVMSALSALEVPDPPTDLVNRAVLRAVQRRAREAEAPAWRQWLKPRIVRLRLSPSTLAAVGAFAIALGVLAVHALPHDEVLEVARSESPAPPSAPPAAPESEAMVRLVLPATDAHTVAVAGDFNEWRTDDVYLEDPEGDGVFVGTLRLRPGSYAYMFVIDGERWVTDPYAANHRDDGFGNENAVLRID